MTVSLVFQDIIIEYLEVSCILCIYISGEMNLKRISEAVGLFVDFQNRFPRALIHTISKGFGLQKGDFLLESS